MTADLLIALIYVLVLEDVYQARRKQLQIGGAHIKSNYRLGGGAHIIFFKMTDHFFLGGGGGGHICANY